MSLVYDVMLFIGGVVGFIMICVSLVYDVMLFIGGVVGFIMAIAFAAGHEVFIRGTYQELNYRYPLLFFGSGRRAFITVEVISFFYVVIITMRLTPSLYEQVNSLSAACLMIAIIVPLSLIFPLFYAVAFIPFRIGPISVAWRDENIIWQLERLHKKGELDEGSLRRGLETIHRGARGGNTASASVLERARARTDEFGQAVSRILALIEQQL